MNTESKIQQIAEKAIKEIQEAAASAIKVEKEYRAGEWAPGIGSKYYVHDYDGDLIEYCAVSLRVTERHVKTGHVFPTEAIAEAAKAHADWWREFDMIWDKAPGDKPNAECGRGYITYKTPDFNIGEESTKRLGGEQKVTDMLTRGRVFRFKWGGE